MPLTSETVDLVGRLLDICREKGVAQLNVEGVALIMGPDPRPLRHAYEAVAARGLPPGPDDEPAPAATTDGDDPNDPLFDAVKGGP